MGHIEISKTFGAVFILHQLLKFVVNPNPMAGIVTVNLRAEESAFV
jgi:hypothetical protein